MIYTIGIVKFLFMKKKECPACAVEIDEEAEICPICGYEFPKQSKTVQIMVWVMIILLIFWWVLYYLVRFVSKVLDNCSSCWLLVVGYRIPDA